MSSGYGLVSLDVSVGLGYYAVFKFTKIMSTGEKLRWEQESIISPSKKKRKYNLKKQVVRK